MSKVTLSLENELNQFRYSCYISLSDNSPKKEGFASLQQGPAVSLPFYSNPIPPLFYFYIYFYFLFCLNKGGWVHSELIRKQLSMVKGIFSCNLLLQQQAIMPQWFLGFHAFFQWRGKSNLVRWESCFQFSRVSHQRKKVKEIVSIRLIFWIEGNYLTIK